MRFRRPSGRRWDCLPGIECVEVLEERALLSFSGDLDTSFGTSGIVITNMGSAAQLEALAVQSNGSIVAAGEVPGASGDSSSSTTFAIARYLPSGQLDSGFGISGKQFASLATFNNASSVAIQPDGKILVAGSSSNNGQKFDFGVVRLNSNGSVDTAFGNNGGQALSFGSTNDATLNAITVDGNGLIYLAGAANIGGRNVFAMARLNTDGSVDTNFGVGGLQTTVIGSVADVATGIGIAPGGDIYLGGESIISGGGQQFALARYDTLGGLLNTFGTNGAAFAALGTNDTTNNLVVLPDGRVTMVGTATVGGVNMAAIVRFNGDGALDVGLGGAGFVVSAFNGNSFTANSIAVQKNGNMVVGGTVTGAGSAMGVMRFLAAGSLDVLFGSNGAVSTDFGTGVPVSTALKVQPDGNIVIAGNNGTNFALARFIGPVTFPQGDPTTIERMFRAYSPVGYHFFTTSAAEFNNAVNNGGFFDETTGKPGWSVRAGQASGSVPIYRVYNPNGGHHYLTLNAAERDSLQSHYWVYEKVEGYIYNTQVSGTTTIYHLYQTQVGTHLYTPDQNEFTVVQARFPGIWVGQTRLGFAYAAAAGSIAAALNNGASVAALLQDNSTSLAATANATMAQMVTTSAALPVLAGPVVLAIHSENQGASAPVPSSVLTSDGSPIVLVPAGGTGTPEPASAPSAAWTDSAFSSLGGDFAL